MDQSLGHYRNRWYRINCWQHGFGLQHLYISILLLTGSALSMASAPTSSSTAPFSEKLCTYDAREETIPAPQPAGVLFLGGGLMFTGLMVFYRNQKASHQR